MGMDNLPIPKRELSKMITSAPITVRVQVKGTRKIVREFVVTNELVFKPSSGGWRLINTLDNFIRAILRQ